jgi:cell wall-associated NlpC family hydrolase
MSEHGIWIKRTTARRFYLILPKVAAAARMGFGNLVFFDSLKHCGIVNDPKSFYHAQSNKGTTLSQFGSYWKARVCGFRGMPEKGKPPSS